MKKRFLSIVFGLALTVSGAYGASFATQHATSFQLGCSSTFTITTSCGDTYEVCADNYDNMGQVYAHLQKLEKKCD